MSKGLEALQDLMNGKHKIHNYYVIEKELKALEIIKTKKVAAFLLKWMMNRHTKKTALELYNRSCDEKRQLNEEEYDLLKEVLC